MKNAARPSAWRRSCVGVLFIDPSILISADASALGRPVMTAAPRSAANSR